MIVCRLAVFILIFPSKRYILGTDWKWSLLVRYKKKKKKKNFHPAIRKISLLPVCHLGLATTKRVLRVSDKVRFKPVSSATETARKLKFHLYQVKI